MNQKAETKLTELNDAMKEIHEVFCHKAPALPREPVLRNFYTLSNEQHDREFAFIALSMTGMRGVLWYLDELYYDVS